MGWIITSGRLDTAFYKRDHEPVEFAWADRAKAEAVLRDVAERVRERYARMPRYGAATTTEMTQPESGELDLILINAGGKPRASVAINMRIGVRPL